MDLEQVILDELRGMRSEFNDYARQTEQRMSVLETDSHSIMGNGNPGRMADAEKEIESLQEWRWRVVGIASGAALIVSGVVSVVTWLLK